MTTNPVMSITDEQIAEIEALAEKSAFECCGNYDIGGEYMGQQERICCLDPHRTESEIKVMAEDILSLISRLRAAERDAARYRWLRDSGNFSPSAFGNGWSLNCGYTRAQPGLLDASVDSAMKGDRQ